MLSTHLRHGLLILPLAGGAVLGKIGDTYALSALILLFEPILWWIAIHISIWLFIGQQKRLGIAFLLSTGAGLILLNHPIHPPNAIETDSQFTENLRELSQCYPSTEASSVPIRVLQWHIDESEALGLNAVEISRMQPDVLVLQGLSNSDIGEKIADLLDGEVLHIPASDTFPSTAIVVRGQFETCANNSKVWSSGRSQDLSGVIWIRPNLIEAGPTPIALVHVATPFETGSVNTWHRSIETTIGIIQATTSAIQSDKVIVLGSLAAPRNFHRLSRTMMESGLKESGVPASWPSGFKIAPLPGLIALDRLWTGSDWIYAQSRRIRTLSQSRALIMTDLNHTGSSGTATNANPQVDRQP